MTRKHNTDRNGSNWSEQTKKNVWSKATIVDGFDSTKMRKDNCGAWIEFDKHGDNSENGNGWEIDHVKPVSKGGGDDLNNLQPLQWQNNRHKGDNYPSNSYCIVSATAAV